MPQQWLSVHVLLLFSLLLKPETKSPYGLKRCGLVRDTNTGKGAGSVSVAAAFLSSRCVNKDRFTSFSKCIRNRFLHVYVYIGGDTERKFCMKTITLIETFIPAWFRKSRDTLENINKNSTWSFAKKKKVTDNGFTYFSWSWGGEPGPIHAWILFEDAPFIPCYHWTCLPVENSKQVFSEHPSLWLARSQLVKMCCCHQVNNEHIFTKNKMLNMLPLCCFQLRICQNG